MTVPALIFTLSALGISETAYLIKKRWRLEKPICPIGENCTAVLESKYNRLLFVHNDILGLVFYIACAFIAGLLVLEAEPFALWNAVFAVLTAAGSLISVLLTYLQFSKIKAWCFWCLMSTFTIWLMGIIIII